MINPPNFSELAADIIEELKLLADISNGSIEIYDDSGKTVAKYGGNIPQSNEATKIPYRIEAEPVGSICVNGVNSKKASMLVAKLLNIVYRKKMISTLYQVTLSDSYEEILQRNNELTKLNASLEKEIKQRTKQLSETQAKLAREEKVAAIGRLAAGVAHELNTPIACVRSNLGALADDDFSEEETHEIINESIILIDRAAGIIRDLRSFSHIDDLSESMTNINEEIKHILQHIEVPDNVAIKTNFGVLPDIMVDGKRFIVALMHIIENACDAVKKDNGEVTIITQSANGLVQILIRDTGSGIPDSILNQIYDPFFTTKAVGSGTGLGLTIARDIIRAHNGEIKLNCHPEGGTIADIIMPIY